LHDPRPNDSAMAERVLERFHPSGSTRFRHRFTAPTAAQRKARPVLPAMAWQT
jgi:hypothetical protein